MCGFVCLWKIDDVNLARRMIGKIAHRGPDELQVRQAPGVPAVMAHCRLSIIGPTAGTQPIYSADNLLVANGEIYNYADLRAILGEAAFDDPKRQRDHPPSLPFRRHALDFPAGWHVRLRPRHARAHRRGARSTRHQAAFHGAQGDGLAFASELKAFDGLGFDSVEAIAPGTLYDSRTGTRAWYRMPQGAAEPRPDEAAEPVWRELRFVLESAVRKWMVADVEVGSFLSGGLDSSVIAALAARAIDRPLRTFSVGLAGSPDLAAGRRVADAHRLGPP